ncbi:hypothetical protein HanLR1_Chr09g0301091 [Helianthus annuus]|nr:hypothetical protein HanLR1_Chr09g0301091 [Helianthus annuus]
MAAIEENEAKISVIVIVDKVNKRVVYAEADYTFVDILFSFMTLPLGTIVRILGKVDDKKFEGLGSLNNLYQSLKDFPDCYLSSAKCKPILLNPMSLSYYHCGKLKLKIDDTQPLNYFGCTQDSMCIPSLTSNIERYHRFRVAGCVFVSDIATIIISDNLCVEPYTSESGIRLLTDCGITDTSYLEERKLDMCSNEVIVFLHMMCLSVLRFYILIFLVN